MKQTLLIDVRSKNEYLLGHIKGTINIPTDHLPLHYQFLSKDDAICLICQSSVRAGQALKLMNSNGFDNITLAPQHYNQIDTYDLEKGNNRWSVDRQFRLTLGILLLLFLLGFALVSKTFIIIPLLLCAGLIITSIIDRCYMRIAIANMPWNN
jgi:rhodanese-related sulfurtransferase